MTWALQNAHDVIWLSFIKEVEMDCNWRCFIGHGGPITRCSLLQQGRQKKNRRIRRAGAQFIRRSKAGQTHPFDRRSLHVTAASVYAVTGATGCGLLTNSDRAWTEAARGRPRSTPRSVWASGGLRSKRTQGPRGEEMESHMAWPPVEQLAASAARQASGISH